ncbi:glycosyltransferase [Flavobacteriaceae bacterium]|nr:glycosyltransferase [Flavobacteriaceae bacterium]
MKKRALYIGFNRKYVNKFLDLALSVISNCFDLTHYGPGFSRESEVILGINNWITNQEEYDIIFIDPAIVIYENKIKKEEFIYQSKMNVLQYSYDEFYDNVESYKSFFFSSDKIKVIIGIYDYHVISKKTINYIISSNSLVIDAFGKNLNDSIENIKNKYGDSDFYKRNILQDWHEFEQNFKERIISFPHAVFTNEFVFTPLNKRKIKYNVVGVLYPERKQATKLLSLKLRIKNFINLSISYVKIKTGLNQITDEKLELYFHRYNNKIATSRYVYCSGSPLMYPVRKYFEIPSKRSVTIGWPCNGFEHLGFKHNKNFIVAKNNKELELAMSRHSEEELQRIADEGLKLIWHKHSDYARTVQMKKTFDLIFQGKFKGSYWENGNYILD